MLMFAAVFGDVFQLLDRGDDEVSEYPIQASEDIKNIWPGELGEAIPADYSPKIRIPDNMFIWATMNSADQGVFPMDTAFKRRWISPTWVLMIVKPESLEKGHSRSG